MEELVQQIEQEIKKSDGKWAISISELEGKINYHLNPNKLFMAASIIKIQIMIEIIRQSEENKFKLSDPLPFTPRDVVGGFGILKIMQPGDRFTIWDMLVLMITISDNTATNLLIDLAGIDNIKATMESYGVIDTQLRRKLMAHDLAEKGIHNEITAEEISLLLGKIYNGEIVSPKASEMMLDLLLMQQLNNKIPLHLGEDIRVAHKTGEDEGLTHDTGIVFAKRPFVLCMLAEHLSDEVLGASIQANIAKYIYDFFND